MSEFELFVAMFGNSYLTSRDYPQILTKVKSDAKVFSSKAEARAIADNYKAKNINAYKMQIEQAKGYIMKIEASIKKLSSKKEKQMANLNIKKCKKLIADYKKQIAKVKDTSVKAIPA